MTDSDAKLDDDQVSVISISSESSQSSQGSVTSMSINISICDVEPFVSSDSEYTLVGSDSDNFEYNSDDLDKTDTTSESEIDLMPNNATEIIDEFNHFRTLPEVLNNIIFYPQSGQNFKFLNQLEPSIYTWIHQCNCKYPSEQDNIMKFYFENMLCPILRPKYRMYYQPTMWVENASASLLHFLMRSQSLAKFINKLHFEIKNDPWVDFGIFLFKISKKIYSDSCNYILTVQTEVYIRGTHFVKTHDLDVTNTGWIGLNT